MAEIIIMPKLGFNMDEGQLVKWHRRVGETVKKGEVLFEINTDKTTMPVEATADGTVLQLMLEDGAFASPSGTFTFSYEGVVEGDTLVFFTTGYASDMNMNGRGMEAKTKTILTYVTEAGGTGQFLTNGRFVITQGAIEGDSPTT